jgi:hypothetical protein
MKFLREKNNPQATATTPTFYQYLEHSDMKYEGKEIWA